MTRNKLIPDSAVELYRLGKAMDVRSNKFAATSSALHRELRLKPWETCPLDTTGKCAHPPGTAGYNNWPKAQALAAELDAELEARDGG